MKIDRYSTPEAVLAEWGKRLARQRIALKLSQAALSERAGVSLKTVKNIEAGKDLQVSTLIRVLNELGEGAKLDILIPDDLDSPMELLRKSQKMRKRVSSQRIGVKVAVRKNLAWKWGDES